MNAMPRMIKVCSFLCTALFSLSLILAPTSPAWAFADITPGTGVEIQPVLSAAPTVTTDEGFSDDQIDDLLGDLDVPKEEDDLSTRPSQKTLIQVNTFCRGVLPGKYYDGLWKKLGPSKAKCKEGASGTPGEFLSRTSCRIVPLTDPIVDNATITSSTRCKLI